MAIFFIGGALSRRNFIPLPFTQPYSTAVKMTQRQIIRNVHMLFGAYFQAK